MKKEIENSFYALNNRLGRNYKIALNLQDGENAAPDLQQSPCRPQGSGIQPAAWWEEPEPIRISFALRCFCALIIFVDARERAEAQDEKRSEIREGLAWLRLAENVAETKRTDMAYSRNQSTTMLPSLSTSSQAECHGQRESHLSMPLRRKLCTLTNFFRVDRYVGVRSDHHGSCCLMRSAQR